MRLATIYSLTVSWAIPHLYTGGASSSQGIILVASHKRSDIIIRDIRTDIRTLTEQVLATFTRGINAVGQLSF
jgi:hypothetical protein